MPENTPGLFPLDESTLSFEDVPLEAYEDQIPVLDETLESPASDPNAPASPADTTPTDLPFEVGTVLLDDVPFEMPPGLEDAPAEGAPVAPAEGPKPSPARASSSIFPSTTHLEFMASLDGLPSNEVKAMLEDFKVLLDESSQGRHPLSEVVEVLIYLASVDPLAPFLYENLNLYSYSEKVQAAVAEIMKTAAPSQSSKYLLTELQWSVERAALIKASADLNAALRRGAPRTEIAAIHKRIQIRSLDADEDPFEGVVRSADEWHEEARRRDAVVDRVRLSTGWPHLDASQTKPGDAPGYMSLGHLAGFIAPSGHGKSSFVRELLRNFALDLRNWGLPNGKVLTVIVEEEPERVIEAAGLIEDYSEVKDQVLIAQVNSSRQLFGASFFKTVVQAVKEADAAGQPVREFMPFVVLLDYLQEIVEAGENAYVDAIERTVSLLRGIASCNPDEIEKFSGVRWSQVAPSGMRWPDGLDNHRIAVLVTAQVKSQDEKIAYWKGDARSLPDFTVLNPATGEPFWTPKVGDYRVVRRGDVAGSGKFLNNLSMLGFLHRSNPRAATQRYWKTLPDGSAIEAYRLDDTRARFWFDKMRYGASDPVIPMAFTSRVDGRAGRWADYRAIAEATTEVVTGKPVKRAWDWDWDRNWFNPDTGEGPILPVRPHRSPASRVTY